MRNSVLCFLEETIKKYPDKIALMDENDSLTFLELKKNGLNIAKAIMERLEGRRKPILVYLPKSVRSIAAFVGVLYSGNMYTPADVRFPYEKVKTMIQALEPSLILTDLENEKILLENGIMNDKILNLDALTEPASINLDTKYLLDAIIDTDPIYTFFTSGSTGVPKGVTITNYNVMDYIDWAVQTFDINDTTVMGNQSPFYFDISTQDIYSCFATGATLVIIPERYFAFPVKALEFIIEKQINFLYWVPSAFVSVSTLRLLEKLELSEVTTMMFGGEVMPVKHLNYWIRHVPNLKLIANVYGPTEATVNCTYYIVNRAFQDEEQLPLGKACENTGLLVLTEKGQLVDPKQIHVLGELCVRGSSLSVGYWNDPEKTAQMYIQNPQNNHYEEKIYKTGDLVYYNDLGELMFAGRKDYQIKHMGYRIELGEIESAAMGFEAIVNVCAMYHEDIKQIILFYQTDQNITDKQVKEYLGSVIPKYMVPAKYYKLKCFPYNDNGKIDRVRLRERYILAK